MLNFTTKTYLAIAVVLLVGLAAGWFAGRQSGYTNGVIRGSVAGFRMGNDAIMSGKIKSEVEKLRPESRKLGEAMCAGFRSQLPCRSVADADQMIQSADPVNQMLGQSCKSSLQSLGACGEDYQARRTNTGKAGDD